MEPGHDRSSFSPDPVSSVPLRPAEVVLITNGVSWYLRSRLAVDGNRITGTTPRTVLGLVPIGRRPIDVGLRELRSIGIGTKLNGDRLAPVAILGLVLGFARLALVPRILVAVAAVAFLLLSFVAVVRIEVEGGDVHTVPVCLAHLRRARRFIAEVELRAVAGRPGSGEGVG